MDPRDNWCVCLSGEIDLNFMIYTATAYGLFAEKDSKWPPEKLFEQPAFYLEKLHAQWTSWWNLMLKERAQGAKIRTAANAVSPPFDKLDSPELREALTQAWPSFIRWWYMPAGGQNAMYYWEGVPNIDSYIYELKKELGREYLSFRLNMDLVYGGIPEPIEVGEDYMVVPVHTNYIMNKDWWKQILAARIRE
ncbi:hypothetical protein [Paenibacillus sp. SAF-054]